MQMVFQRYELKYLLTPAQKALVLQAMEGRMERDQYGRTVIRSLYYDTPTWLLARRSLERPVYKEKLRLRGYGAVGPDSLGFAELKKKHDSVVYKRRLALPWRQAARCLSGAEPFPQEVQIARELAYCLKFYGTLRPAVFSSYEREAYFALDGSDLRMTLDENALARRTQLALDAPLGGTALLPTGYALLEVKTGGGLPLWLTRAFAQGGIYKTSFSKYGTAYRLLAQGAPSQTMNKGVYYA